MDNPFDMTKEEGEAKREEEAQERFAAGEKSFRRGFLGGFLTGMLLFCALLGGAALGRYMAQKKMEAQLPETMQGQGILTEEFMAEVDAVYRQIGRYFLYEYEDKALQDGMLSGMLKALDDPYSVY